MKHRTPFHLLCLGALGVVFGDIGTSPLYTLKVCMREAATSMPDETGAYQATLFGVLSLIVWSLVLVVTVKYLLFIMRANNKTKVASSRCSHSCRVACARFTRRASRYSS